MKTDHALGDLEDRLARGVPMSRGDAERVFQCADLVSVGVVGEQARRRLSGSRVTFGRVLPVAGALPASAGEAGEVRLIGTAGSIDDVRGRVRTAVAWAQGRPVTGFTMGDLRALVGDDRTRLVRLAADLASDGLFGIAAVEVDDASSDEVLIGEVQGLLDGGLCVRRLTVGRAEGAVERLALIERACAVQAATGAVAAFAPLPDRELPESPSTGYDDVKTVAAARVRCRDIASIQVDWQRHGPKLAQVAVTFGANDIDGIAVGDVDALGPRRTAIEDIRRQIRSAGGEPVERDARYERGA